MNLSTATAMPATSPEQAFNAIHAANARRIQGFINSRIGYRDRQLAEDLTQETFLDLWRGYILPGKQVDHPVALLKVIAERRICAHMRLRKNQELTLDLTDKDEPATQHLAAALADAPHLARLYTDLEAAKDALVPLALAYRAATKEHRSANISTYGAVRPEAVARCNARLAAAVAAVAAATSALRDAGDRVTAARLAWDEAATVLGNHDDEPAIPKLPRPRPASPDSAVVNHPGDSDPNPDEALRRVKVGAGR